MGLDTFLPGIKAESKLLYDSHGELQLRQLNSDDGFSTGRERYMLWLVNEKQLTLTGFCLKHADKLTVEDYQTLLSTINSREDFQHLAQVHDDKYSASSTELFK